MTRKIDELGRIVIPREIRKNLNWNEKDEIEIVENESSVILRKCDPECIHMKNASK